MTRLPTLLAIAGMTVLAAAGLVILHDKDLALAAVSAMGGWLSPRPHAPDPQTPAENPQAPRSPVS
jgi:hypothetical protein